MSPTFRQRLGRDPVDLATFERAQLGAARVAASLYAGVATLALIAAIISADFAARPLLALGSAGTAYAAAALILLAYERLTRLHRFALAVTASSIIALQVYGSAHGIMYGPLYAWLALFVAFYYPRRQAFVQIVVVVVTLAVALFARYGFREALGQWVLLAGVLGGTGVVTTILRGRLNASAAGAFEDRASLKAFFDHASGGFAIVDGESRYVHVNRPLAEIIGASPEELAGKRLADVDDYHCEKLEPLVRSVRDSGRQLLEVELLSGDGSRHYLADFYPVGRTGAVGMAVVDVTRSRHQTEDLTESNRRLAVLAATDDLTGLPNRRVLSEQLELALARARRGGLAVALLSIDLDRFKDVNDSLGHAYGDQLLTEAASLLRQGARATDVVARVGGDEFVVLLADLDMREAPALVQTVVDRIQSLLGTPISIGPVELRADASIGRAIYPIDARDEIGLLDAADVEMYRRKSAPARVA